MGTKKIAYPFIVKGMLIAERLGGRQERSEGVLSGGLRACACPCRESFRQIEPCSRLTGADRELGLTARRARPPVGVQWGDRAPAVVGASTLTGIPAGWVRTQAPQSGIQAPAVKLALWLPLMAVGSPPQPSTGAGVGAGCAWAIAVADGHEARKSELSVGWPALGGRGFCDVALEKLMGWLEERAQANRVVRPLFTAISTWSPLGLH
ncbi:hypothetical protein FGB62_324g03 [Gracilaria domingensis]|nr:hypothetical protein FGB62_324g03 [Gracilaria domingensis]